MTVHGERTRRASERLAEVGAEAAVLFPSTNLTYLSGVREEPAERHLFLSVPSAESEPPDASDGQRSERASTSRGRGPGTDPVFLVPALYGTQVREESWVGTVHTWADGEDPVVVTDVGGERLNDSPWTWEPLG